MTSGTANMNSRSKVRSIMERKSSSRFSETSELIRGSITPVKAVKKAMTMLYSLDAVV